MLSKISQSLSDIITKELDFDEEKKEVITYSIEYLFLQLFGFITIIIVAFFFGVIKTALIASVFGAVLRKFSGGAHFSSSIMCLSFGAFVYTAIGKIAVTINNFPNFNFNYIFIFLILSLVIVYRLAPVDSPAKPIHSQDFKNRLKLASLIFVILTIILIFLINSETFQISAALGVIYQTATLLPVFNKKEVKL